MHVIDMELNQNYRILSVLGPTSETLKRTEK